MSPVCIWTRTLSDWSEDEALLAASQVSQHARVVHYPCLELRAVNPRQPHADLFERREFTHAVLTSANAVHFAWKEPALHQILNGVQLIYTHGKSTAEALQNLGLPVLLVPGVRTAEELTREVIPLLPKDAVVALPGAEKPAFDMQAALQAEQVEAMHIVCYRTAAAMRKANGEELSRSDVMQLQKELAGAVCFASPSAVQAFCEVMTPGKTRLKESLTAVAIGPSTAKACEGQFARIVTAELNQLEGLVRAAEAVLAKRSS